MIRTLTDYIEQAKSLEQSVYSTIDKMQSNAAMTNGFLRFRANKRKFLPGNTDDDLESFRKAEFNVALSARVEIKTELQVLIDLMEVSGNTAVLDEGGKQPYIFCTFHFGPFRLIGPLLATHGYDLSVLTLKSGITPDLLHTSANDDLEVLYADSSSVMLEMMNNLKNGKSLKTFIDGNAGLVKDPDVKSFAKTKFLGNEFYCKKGIPYLSYVSGVPIIPILSYRESLTKTRIIFGDPIHPDKSVSREQFAQNTIQFFYDWMEPYLQKYPEQWVYWQVMHEFMDIEKQQQIQHVGSDTFQEGMYGFNQERYELFHTSTANYLFDKNAYKSFTISNNLSQYLTHLQQQPETSARLTARVNSTMLRDLLTKQVLVATA